jgi:WD40 repeat protein
MKVIIPLKVLERIEAKCPRGDVRAFFHPKELVEPLKEFINTKLETFDKKLYAKYRSHRGYDERTLRFAWSQEGNKADGAVHHLRDLLCYYGWGKQWKNVLEDLGLNEETLIRATRTTKEKSNIKTESTKESQDYNLKTADIVSQTDKLLKYNVTKSRLTCCYIFNSHTYLTTGFDRTLHCVNSQNNQHYSCLVSNSNIRVIFQVGKTSFVLLGDDEGDIIALNLLSFQHKKVANAESSVFSICNSNRKGFLLISERNGKVKEWEVSNFLSVQKHNEFPKLDMTRVIHSHRAPCFMVLLNMTTEECFSVSGDGYLYSTQLSQGKFQEKQFLHPLYSISGNGQEIVIGGGSGFVFAKLENAYKQIQAHNDTIRTITISKSGNWMFTGSKDKSVKIWNRQTLLSWILFKSDEYIYDIRLNDEQTELLIADGSGHLTVIKFKKSIDELSQQEMQKIIEQLKLDEL